MSGRTIAVALIALAAGLAGTTGTAQANTCAGQYFLDGVGGQTIYIGEHQTTLPKVEDVWACAGSTALYVDTFPIRVYSGCGPTCFAVFAPATVQSGDVVARVCYTLDGVPQCVGPDQDVRLPSTERCLISSGRPAQHLPGQCLVVIDQVSAAE